MKRIISIILAIGVEIPSFGQIEHTITSDNIVSESFKGVFIEMPGYRETHSGTKLVVNYEEGTPAELQGAFEYAVKIWEEVLPLSLPINIDVKIAKFRGSNNVLSKVNYVLYNYDGSFVNKCASPVSMIKSVLLQEYHSKSRVRFFEEISNTSILEKTDITITYNSDMLNQCDFSLDGQPNENKYDFVTVVMRDIALGLGFGTSYSADEANEEIIFTGERLTPFEYLIKESLNTDDPHQAFINATQGSVEIPLKSFTQPKLRSISVYAPQVWVNGKSLRLLIPNDNPISKLLSYDFGKGYIMRDLSGVNWDMIFSDALDWRREYPVGAKSGSVSNSGTSEDVIPYKGVISLSSNGLNKNDVKYEYEYRQSTNNTGIGTSYSMDNQTDLPIELFCQRYNVFSPEGTNKDSGLSLSVLKKDGSWDNLYNIYYHNEPITINIDDLNLNFPDSEYARGTTGGLRYRLSFCEQKVDELYNKKYYDYSVKYFTRDYTPQKAKISFTQNYALQDVNLTPGIGNIEYGFRDVKIGISNVEGTTKVIVEQLDEGEYFPFQYEAEDFRKGFFIANLDMECSTQITVVSYNENGYQRSETLAIPPLSDISITLRFHFYDELIEVEGLSEVALENREYQYSIMNLSRIGDPVQGYTMHTSQIDTNDLPSGIYVLTIYDKNGSLGYYKFAK